MSGSTQTFTAAGQPDHSAWLRFLGQLIYLIKWNNHYIPLVILFSLSSFNDPNLLTLYHVIVGGGDPSTKHSSLRAEPSTWWMESPENEVFLMKWGGDLEIVPVCLLEEPSWLAGIIWCDIGYSRLCAKLVLELKFDEDDPPYTSSRSKDNKI